MLSMILGTPWKRKYKASPQWDTNAIHFQQEDGYINQPFVPAKSATSTTQHKVITDKGKQKAMSMQNQAQKRQAQIWVPTGKLKDQFIKAPGSSHQIGHKTPIQRQPSNQKSQENKQVHFQTQSRDGSQRIYIKLNRDNNTFGSQK